MEYRLLGNTGMHVPVLSLGTATFGGTNDFFKKWGTTDIKEASRLIDVSLDHGLNFFDTANVYSQGASEEVLGGALKGRRDKSIISTKVSFQMGTGINDKGASRYHIIREIAASLRRLATDYIDLYFIHGFDPFTPIEETLYTLDQLVSSGKVRYLGVSNFASWQVMKALAASEKLGIQKFSVYQGYYSLIGRDYEWDLMPMIEDQHLGLMAWSPLGWGRLTGKIRRGKQPSEGRIQSGGSTGGPDISDERLFEVMDVLDQIAVETGKTVSQISINWLLHRKTLSNIVIGARDEKQLRENIDSVGWKLSREHIQKIENVTSEKSPYPHWVGAR